MGRAATGAITVNQCRKLQIKALLDTLRAEGVDEATGELKLGNGLEMAFNAIIRDGEGSLDLLYQVCHGEACRKYSYRVNIVGVPSNIGRGFVYYFICPWSGVRCRTLYMAYGSPVWKARAAYSNRIYYPSQLSSRVSRFNDAYWRIERELQELLNRRRSYSYNGKPTRLKKRIDYLHDLQGYYDELRFAPFALPAKLRALFGELDEGLFRG